MNIAPAWNDLGKLVNRTNEISNVGYKYITESLSWTSKKIHAYSPKKLKDFGAWLQKTPDAGNKLLNGGISILDLGGIASQVAQVIVASSYNASTCELGLKCFSLFCGLEFVTDLLTHISQFFITKKSNPLAVTALLIINIIRATQIIVCQTQKTSNFTLPGNIGDFGAHFTNIWHNISLLVNYTKNNPMNFSSSEKLNNLFEYITKYIVENPNKEISEHEFKQKFLEILEKKEN